MVELTATKTEEWEPSPEALARLEELGKGLTIKQKRLVAAKLQGLNGVESAKFAGYNGQNNASLAVTANLTVAKPAVASYMRALAEECGLSDRFLLKTLKNGLEAKRSELDKQGNVRDLGPDWLNRGRMLELALKVTGAFPDPRVALTGADGGAIVVRHTPSLL